MTTNKYANGKIYRLVNDVDNKLYLGSTITTLTKRKNGHKTKSNTKIDLPVYQHLNEIGWENVEIVLIENYPCKSKEELNARERHWIDELKPELNLRLPCRTKQQWKEEHKEEIAEKNKQYYEENKEIIGKKAQQYREANKEKIAEKQRQYEEANREAINERRRIQHEANKDVINERRRQLYHQKKQQAN